MDSQALAAASFGGGSVGTHADELFTPNQAGDYLRTGERFVRRLIAERRIPYVKLGRYVRLQRSALDAFIESGYVNRRRASSPREVTPVFVKQLRRWTSTVRGETQHCAATSSFDMPSLTSCASDPGPGGMP